ncbi:MAG TPA: ATP-binding cassette domain-containing protein, partial [Acidobacteriota bacterium]|nr:ATP-binding cassette domain-containing protein [Acidobacteriota bacterium]
PGAGEVVGPQSVAVGYYEQTNVSSLIDANTVLDEIASANIAQDPKLPRLIAGAMIFEGDDALKPVRVLSGGEKSRVMLGKLIATPVNLLLLDEPTNHLDLESSDALLEALDGFDGAVVMVTHNEMFLHALAERLVVFQDGGITVYEGSYQRFLEKVGWNEEAERPGKDVAEPEAPADRKNPKGMRKLRSGIIAERSRVLKPLEKRMAEVEAEIERNDAELRAMNEAVIEASRAKDGTRVVEFSKSMHRTKASTDRLFMELEWLAREHDEKNAAFEEKLKALGEEGESGENPGGPPERD